MLRGFRDVLPKRMGLSAALGAVLALAAASAVAQQNTGVLKTKVNPGRAGVFVDGKYVGPAENFGASRNYTLPAGQHEVRLSEPRYEDAVEKVTIEAGKTTKLEQTLKPLAPAKPPFGILRTLSPDKFAAVYVNNKYMGHAGEFNNPVQGLKLNPGEYTVRIVPVGNEKGSEDQIQIEADKVTIVPARAAETASNDRSGTACATPTFSDQSGIALAADCR